MDNPTEVKAGARHNAIDKESIANIHTKAQEIIAHAVSLGAGDGAPQDTPALAIKALSYNEVTSAVSSAVYRASANGGDGDYGGTYVEEVYPGYAIVRTTPTTYLRADYTVGPDNSITIADPALWTPVEKGWASTSAPDAETPAEDATPGDSAEDGMATNGGLQAVKSLGGARIGAYTVIYGDSTTPDLSPMRDYFTKATDYWLNEWTRRPMIYHHAGDPATADDPVVGFWDKATADDIGIWLEGELNKSHQYATAISTLVSRGALKLSSDSAPHLVRRTRQANGTNEVTRWPILASSLTPTPAEPRLLAVEQIKSAYKALNVPLPSVLDAAPATKANATGSPAGAQSADDPATVTASKSTSSASHEVKQMKTIPEFVAAARDAVIAGDMDKANGFRAQAEALKALDAIEAPAPVATPVPTAPVRLPFATKEAAPATKSTGESAAIKTWYNKKYGDLDVAMEAVASELHGGEDYKHMTWAKNADYKRFLRTGVGDPELMHIVLLTPAQIFEGISSGYSVKEMKATMVEASDVLGGYVVPEDFRNTVIQRLPGLTAVRPLANVITTSSDRVLWPKSTGGNNQFPSAARVTWTEETPAAGASATNATWGQVPIPIHTAMSTTTLSRNSLEDAAFDVALYLSNQFSIAAAIDEDIQFLTGNGAGRPQGILGLGGVPIDSDIVTVKSGNAATLSNDGMIAVPYGLAGQYRQAGAVWVMNKATIQAIRQLKDTNSRYLWADNNNQLAPGQPERLLGYALKETEAMPAIGANTYPVLFGDMKGYTIADRIGMSIERYIDSTTAQNNAVMYIMRRRLGGQVTEGWRFVAHQCHT